MKKEHVIIMAAILLIVGGFVGMEIQNIKTNPENLPDCKYSFVGEITGNVSGGYWVGFGDNHKPACIAKIGV